VKIEVWVDGRRWRQVASFAEPRADEDVFVLDRESGSVRFGDGVNGRLPPMGAEVIVAVYRHGAGSSADTGTDAPPIRTSRSDVVDTTDLALWTVIRTQTSSIPIPIHCPGKTAPGDRCSRRTRSRHRLAVAFVAGVITSTAVRRPRRN
jgi:hypothetical protein